MRTSDDRDFGLRNRCFPLHSIYWDSWSSNCIIICLYYLFPSRTCPPNQHLQPELKSIIILFLRSDTVLAIWYGVTESRFELRTRGRSLRTFLNHYYRRVREFTTRLEFVRTRSVSFIFVSDIPIMVLQKRKLIGRWPSTDLA